jgi:uncharacterized membrane protein YdbT with pleckstrin-like domain
MGKIKESFDGMRSLLINKKVFIRLVVLALSLSLAYWIISEKQCVTKYFQYSQKPPELRK